MRRDGETVTRMVIEATRYGILCVGLAIIGVNLAFIRHAPRVLGAWRAWRWYLGADSALTVYVVLSIRLNLENDSPWDYRLFLGVFAILATLVSLLVLYFEHEKCAALKRREQA